MDCSMPGFSVLHYLPEFAEIYVHWVSDAIQPSHPLLPSFLSSIFPSIRVFSNESALRIRWPKYWSFSFSLGFPGHSAGKESACNAGDPSSIPGLGRSPGRERLPTPVFCPGEFHGLYSPWGHKKLEMTEQLWFSLSFSFSTNPSNEYSGLISFRID